MNSSVMLAVTTPSATHVRNVERVNEARRGRTTTSRIRPAQDSRSHAAPSAPIRSISSTDRARPICTHATDAVAIRTPVRTSFVVTFALNGTATVHVHVIYLDIPFTKCERLVGQCHGGCCVAGT